MNGEDSFEAVQYVPVLKTDFIMKTTLDKELCNTLIELAGKKLETNIVDNLEDVRRTGWHLQRDKDVAPYLQKVTAKVEHCISTRLNYPHFNKRKPAAMSANGMQFVIAMYNAWISFYKDNSFVHPHCHAEAPNFYSIAAYLSTGDSDTSLNFMTDESPSHGINRPRVVCKQGDLVIFPSNLYHYTNDTSDERIVLSGNYYAGYMPNINMGEG
jgi:uncharacterized protein YjlB